MIILRHKQKEYSGKLAKTVYVKNKTVNSLIPKAKKKSAYALKRSAIAEKENILNKAAGAASDYIHITNGKINPGKSITKVAGKVIENPISGTVAVAAPGGSLAFPVLSNVEGKVTPKKLKNILETRAARVKNNDNLADRINNSINKTKQILGL